jgi:SpoVK/Ycf46/Vps4 family AAA+-type ATPase
MSSNLDALRQAVSFSPDNLPLLVLLGEGCLDHFLFEEAKQNFQKVLSLDPGHVGAQLGLARASYQEGNLSEAVVRAEAIAAAHPRNGSVWRLLSRLAFIEGHLAQAREYYAKARQIDPDIHDEGLEKDLAGKQPPLPPFVGQTNKPVPAGAAEAEDDDEQPSYDFESKNDASALGLVSDLAVEFERPTVKFADVGGMNAVKEEIRMKIIYPLQNAELFKQYGKKTGGGVLLYGPPGCGKTLLSRATAGEIKATFLSIGIHQVLDMWLGNSEKNLHKIFELARQNTPAILFFDEVDALASDRASMKQSAGRNVINQFLAEMDGAIGNNEGILVLGATNAPWQVDSAFRRPGRFDRVLFVPPPDEDARASIIELMAKGKPVHKLDARALAKRTKDYSGADLKAVFDVASEEKLAIAMRENRVVPITTDDLIRAAKSMQPSTRAWFESAKNYACMPTKAVFTTTCFLFWASRNERADGVSSQLDSRPDAPQSEPLSRGGEISPTGHR